MLSRLNGWQRIGVVLSFLWVCWVALIAINSHQAGHGSFIHVIAEKEGYCRKYEPVAPSGRSPPTAEEYFGTGKCLPENYVDAIPGEKHFQSGSFLLAALVPVVIGWLGVYLLIYVMRWVVAGFRRGAA